MEERKVKLELDRNRLEEKLLEKANKYEEKLREIKESRLVALVDKAILKHFDN